MRHCEYLKLLYTHNVKHLQYSNSEPYLSTNGSGESMKAAGETHRPVRCSSACDVSPLKLEFQVRVVTSDGSPMAG